LYVYSFIVTFSNRAPDPERDSAAVQEFLENMEGAFRSHTPWAGSSEEELESAGEVIYLFCDTVNVQDSGNHPPWNYIRHLLIA
jgi:hypothetical protein